MSELKKTVVWLVILLLVVNLVVFALKLISTLLFWGIIVVAGLFAYKGLKRLN